MKGTMYDTLNCQKELKFETDIGIEVSHKYIYINKKMVFLVDILFPSLRTLSLRSPVLFVPLSLLRI